MRLPWNKMRKELDGEIAHHLYHLAQDYERQGYSPAEARQMAKRSFGGAEQVKEICSDESGWAWLAGITQDLTFGWRMMRRTPAITIAVVLSLALGIGATTAMVSLMDVVLWRQLPLPKAQQLKLIYWQGFGFPRDLANGAAGSMWAEDGLRVADFFSYLSFERMRKGTEGKASIAAYTFPSTVSASFEGKAMLAQERPISGNFLSTLQVRPEMGRLLSEADENSSAAGAVVVTHRFWEKALGSDPAAIGKTLQLDNKSETIVGVLEPRFYGIVPGDGAEVYAPLYVDKRVAQRGLNDHRYWGFSLLARRSDGISDAQLQALLDTLFRGSWVDKLKDPTKAPRIRLDDGAQGLDFLRREFRNPLFVLGGLVALLLIIACSNIANLLLAQGIARRRETAARVALGCSRGRLIRQFVTESGLLAVLGGVASIAIGWTTANLMGRFLAVRDGLPIEVDLDLRVLAATMLVTGAALLLFAVLPALQASRLAQVTWGRTGMSGLGTVTRSGKWNAGHILVAGQMAMAVLLVLSAVIFVRNFLALQNEDPGFDRRNLVVFGIRPGTSGYAKDKLAPFYLNLERRLAETPGVMAVGMAQVRPMDVGGWWESVRLAGQQTAGDASINGITPGYLPLYGVRVLAGRNISRADVDSKASVAMISEDLASKLGGKGVLGQMIEFPDVPPGADIPHYQIIGIVAKMAVTSMKSHPFAVWLPAEKDVPGLSVVLRTASSPTQELGAIRKTVADMDRNLPLVEVTTMEEQIAKGLQRERMFATLCGGAGTLALILTVVGLYGVLSYSTSRRKGEIGVRMTLGALPKDVFSMVMREGLGTALIGIVLAAPIAWLGARLVEKLLSNMKPLEAGTLTWTLGVLFVAAVVAVGMPAFRASLVQPAETLREE